MNLEKMMAIDFQRKRELDTFSSILKKYKTDWVSISVAETRVTSQFGMNDLNQAIHGLRFPEYVLESIENRKPVGRVNLQYPANSPGVATGVSFAAAYLTGNKIKIRISSNQKKLTDFLSQMVKKAGLQKIDFSYGSGKDFVKLSISGDCNAFHAFGHDRVYAPMEPEINQAIENSLLDVFIAELAGKDAFLVHPNADIKKAADDYRIAATLSAGQICMSPEMAFVPEDKVDEFNHHLLKDIHAIRIGDPSHPDTIVGPLINKKVFDNAAYLIEDAVKKKQAEEISIKGLTITDDLEYLMPPRLLIIKDDKARIIHEESFCPAYVIIPYKDIETAYQHLKNMKYGLTMSVYGDEKEIFFTKKQMDHHIGIIFENIPFFKGFDIHKKNADGTYRGWGGYKLSGWVQKKNRNGLVVKTDGPKHLPELFSKE